MLKFTAREVTLVLVALVAVAQPARATTFEDVTVEDLARASDLVVMGRVQDVDVHALGPSREPNPLCGAGGG